MGKNKVRYRVIKVQYSQQMFVSELDRLSDFTDIGDWPTLSAAVAGPRCHSTPPPQDTDSSHHNGNADQDRKPLEEHHHQQQPRLKRWSRRRITKHTRRQARQTNRQDETARLSIMRLDGAALQLKKGLKEFDTAVRAAVA
ncbi:hypothetical protein evm_013007 [Chilo suppressalis]|nr:hypothetical protein evm_013007 [Chilo suppressalis]